MCSGQAGCTPRHGGRVTAEPLAVVAQAIDDLAAADAGSLTPAELTRRVARVWTLIGHLDPELARRAAAYTGYARGSATAGAGSVPDAASDPDDLDV